MENQAVQTSRVITNIRGMEVLQVARARLEVIYGRQKGSQFELKPHENVIGTANNCHIVLDDDSISRRHLYITPGEFGFHLEDKGSTNGTRINGLRVSQAMLEGGEVIEIGNTRLHFIVHSQTDEFPLSNKSSFGHMLGRSLSMRRVSYNEVMVTEMIVSQ